MSESATHVQIVCGRHTALVEQYGIFLKAQQLLAQALPSRSAFTHAARPPGHSAASAAAAALPGGRQSVREGEDRAGTTEREEEEDEEVSTSMRAIPLPSALLRGWLQRREADVEHDDEGDRDEHHNAPHSACDAGNRTRGNSSREITSRGRGAVTLDEADQIREDSRGGWQAADAAAAIAPSCSVGAGPANVFPSSSFSPPSPNGKRAWLTVQSALEYVSRTYGPVHATSWFQFEELCALHAAEHVTLGMFSTAAVDRSGKNSTSSATSTPCMVVSVVLLWLHEGVLYALTPSELAEVEHGDTSILDGGVTDPTKTVTQHDAPERPVNSSEKSRSTAVVDAAAAATGTDTVMVSSPPSHALRSASPSASLLTCQMALEYPPGTLLPRRLPLPLAEPLLTRQELMELVRTTANIRRHHPLRVAYRLCAEATRRHSAGAAARPGSSRLNTSFNSLLVAPGGGNGGGVWNGSFAFANPSTSLELSERGGLVEKDVGRRRSVLTPTLSASPLHAIESDEAVAAFVRDVLTYGSAAVRVVAVERQRGGPQAPGIRVVSAKAASTASASAPPLPPSARTTARRSVQHQQQPHQQQQQQHLANTLPRTNILSAPRAAQVRASPQQPEASVLVRSPYDVTPLPIHHSFEGEEEEGDDGRVEEPAMEEVGFGVRSAPASKAASIAATTTNAFVQQHHGVHVAGRQILSVESTQQRNSDAAPQSAMAMMMRQVVVTNTAPPHTQHELLQRQQNQHHQQQQQQQRRSNDAFHPRRLSSPLDADGEDPPTRHQHQHEEQQQHQPSHPQPPASASSPYPPPPPSSSSSPHPSLHLLGDDVLDEDGDVAHPENPEETEDGYDAFDEEGAERHLTRKNSVSSHNNDNDDGGRHRHVSARPSGPFVPAVNAACLTCVAAAGEESSTDVPLPGMDITRSNSDTFSRHSRTRGPNSLSCDGDEGEYNADGGGGHPMRSVLRGIQAQRLYVASEMLDDNNVAADMADTQHHPQYQDHQDDSFIHARAAEEDGDARNGKDAPAGTDGQERYAALHDVSALSPNTNTATATATATVAAAASVGVPATRNSGGGADVVQGAGKETPAAAVTSAPRLEDDFGMTWRNPEHYGKPATREQATAAAAATAAATQKQKDLQQQQQQCTEAVQACAVVSGSENPVPFSSIAADGSVPASTSLRQPAPSSPLHGVTTATTTHQQQQQQQGTSLRARNGDASSFTANDNDAPASMTNRSLVHRCTLLPDDLLQRPMPSSPPASTEAETHPHNISSTGNVRADEFVKGGFMEHAEAADVNGAADSRTNTSNVQKTYSGDGKTVAAAAENVLMTGAASNNTPAVNMVGPMRTTTITTTTTTTNNNAFVASPSAISPKLTPTHRAAAGATMTTTSSVVSSSAVQDPHALVFVRYEADPTAVFVSGPVTPDVLQQLQDVIFRRCCAHLSIDADAPRPRFHVRHSDLAHSGSGGCSPQSVSRHSGIESSHNITNSNLNNMNSYSPTSQANSIGQAAAVEYVLPLYAYRFSRTEEKALECCIAEVMAVYQGLEQLPAKEAEEWVQATMPGTRAVSTNNTTTPKTNFLHSPRAER